MRREYLIICSILIYLLFCFLPQSIHSITLQDFRVNSDSAEHVDQFGTGIVFDRNGNFAVVWCDRGLDHNNRQIYFQRFDSLGNRIGGPVLVSDSTNHKNNDPQIAMAPSGSFVICWLNWIYVGDDRLIDIWVQGFDSLGQPAWPRKQVDIDRPTYSLTEWMPSMAMDKDGNFIVVWATQDSTYERDVYAQRFSSSGERIGNNFRVNQESRSSSQFPDVAFNSQGYFLICWQGVAYCPGWFSDYVLARIYNPAGEPITNELQLFSPCVSKWKGSAVPAVAANSQNNFIIAANAFDTLHTYPNNTVIVQTFDTLGNPVDTAKVVSDVIDMKDIFFRPRIAIDSADDYVVVWSDLRCQPFSNLWAQRFNSSGEPRGQNYRINIPPGSLSSPDGLYGDWRGHDVAFHKNTVGISWVDLRNWEPFEADIYAKLLDLDKIGYYMRGDVVLDGKINLVDVIYLANYLLKSGWGILPLWPADTNCDGKYGLVDVILLARYVLLGQPFPC